VLEEILPLLERERRLNGITLRREYGEGIPPVKGDPSMIRQIFQDLLYYAVGAVKPGGEILVETASEEDRVRVRVSDNGPGIPEDRLGRVFDATPAQDATNLAGPGLPLCAALLKEMGGEIRAENGPGPGKTFIVTLPLRFEPPVA
jgi:signal transduction histidine kinase